MANKNKACGNKEKELIGLNSNKLIKKINKISKIPVHKI